MKACLIWVALCVPAMAQLLPPIPPSGPFPIPVMAVAYCNVDNLRVTGSLNDNLYIDVDISGGVNQDGLRFAIDRWDGTTWVRLDVSGVLAIGTHLGTFDVTVSRTIKQYLRVLVVDGNGEIMSLPQQFDTLALITP